MPFSFHSRTGRKAPLARLLVTASLLAMPLALTGCGIFGGDDEYDIPQYVAKPCPAIGILKDSEKITVFNGGGQDAADIVTQAEIRKAVITCEYDEDDFEISVDFGFDGTVLRGPASTSAQVTLPGYMAITRNGRIISKTNYDIPVEFENGATEMRFLKTVEDTILPYGDRLNGASYEILVGFQVTPAQLAYNRRSPGSLIK